ncbi:MAG: TIGR04053 family radical SAM/SPASM domain-containing protein [Nitrospinota bacterium]
MTAAEMPQAETPAGAPARPFPAGKPDFRSLDFSRTPFIVIWEVTQACDLACLHCRAQARPWRDPCELTTEEGFRLLDDVRKFGPVLFVLTGGDPLYRPDIYEIIRYGTDIGLRMTMTPSGTKLVRKEMIRRMKDEGLARLAVSLDGHDRESHDGFRGVPGSFAWTMNCIRWAREVGLELQVNTTVTRYNRDHIREIGEMLRDEGIALWSVFFLVPVGRGLKHDMVSPAEHEELFHLLYDMSREMPYDIKTTAAQHFRRVVLQRAAFERIARGGGAHNGDIRPGEPGGDSRPGFLPPGRSRGFDAGIGRAAKGVNDGNGFVFISHVGEVFPSGFLPRSGGNVRERSVVEVYRESELFKTIRRVSALKGKCGYCDFADVCAGSRARAYGVTGDYLASEPYCTYNPPKPGSGRPVRNSYAGPHAESGVLSRVQVTAALGQ